MLRSNGRRRSRPPFHAEPLEGRQLLSIYTGPSTIRPVVTPGAIYQLTVTGGGFERVYPIAPGVYGIKLLGTTGASALSVSVLRTRGHHPPVPLQIGEINVNSGQLGAVQALNTADLLGTITPIHGSVTALQFDGIGPNARVDISGALGSLDVANSVDLGPNGHIHVAGNLTQELNVGGQLLIDGGQITFGNDAAGAVNVGALTLRHGGLLSVQRDWTGGVTVSGDLTLDTGGNISAGRDFQNLTVNGNVVVTPSGGALAVGGNFTNFRVNGDFQGKGAGAPDLAVGLNLNQVSILGGGANQGGLQHASFAIGKNLVGFNVPHGVFNSLITAGVAIDGGNPGGSNIGPDGIDAVFDSQIRAGLAIRNFLIDGNVRSDWVTNPHPTGYPTRIVAGEDRAGVFGPGGTIDNFQITGQLIDAVLAASVQPSGGDGSLPVSGYNAPPSIPNNTPGDLGFNTYDKPFGTITGGTVGKPVPYPNYTELSYYNETLTGVSWDRNPPTGDPTIDDFIFPGGTINASFASAPRDAASLADPTAKLPLPTRSTVLGGVVSTPHGDNADFAGLFAADTRGVFVGSLPQ